MNAFVSVCLVVECKCGKNPQFDATSIAIFLNRSDDFDRTFRSLFLVKCLNDLSKSTLAEQLDNIIWKRSVECHGLSKGYWHTSIGQWYIRTNNVVTVVIVNFLMLVQILFLVSQWG